MTERIFFRLDTLDESTSYEAEQPNTFRVPCDEADANLVSSLCKNGKHMPVLDLDGMDPMTAIERVTELLGLRHFPGRAVPSSTDGHYHLFVDHEMEWQDYSKLLDVLVFEGVIQAKYASASKERQATFVRKPGIYKKKVAA